MGNHIVFPATIINLVPFLFVRCLFACLLACWVVCLFVLGHCVKSHVIVLD